jgi:putative addiction module killer protein
MILYTNKFKEWQDSLDKTTRIRVGAAVKKIEWNLGVLKQLSERVYECKLDFGPGWRIYYTKYKGQIVVILGGGNKKTQQQDIERAESLVQEADKKVAEYLEQLKLR